VSVALNDRELTSHSGAAVGRMGTGMRPKQEVVRRGAAALSCGCETGERPSALPGIPGHGQPTRQHGVRELATNLAIGGAGLMTYTRNLSGLWGKMVQSQVGILLKSIT